MGIHKGSEGTVHVGSNPVAEIRSYSVDHQADTIEDSVMGDTSRTYQVGLQSWSASIDCFWDDDDAPQVSLSAGASVVLKFYPEGTTSSSTYYEGTALITSVNRSSSFDGLFEVSFSATGTGPLSTETV